MTHPTDVPRPSSIEVRSLEEREVNGSVYDYVQFAVEAGGEDTAREFASRLSEECDDWDISCTGTEDGAVLIECGKQIFQEDEVSVPDDVLEKHMEETTPRYYEADVEEGHTIEYDNEE